MKNECHILILCKSTNACFQENKKKSMHSSKKIIDAHASKKTQIINAYFQENILQMLAEKYKPCFVQENKQKKKINTHARTRT